MANIGTTEFFKTFEEVKTNVVNMKMLNEWFTENFMYDSSDDESEPKRNPNVKDKTEMLRADSFGIFYNKNKTEVAFLRKDLVGRTSFFGEPIPVDVFESGKGFEAMMPTFRIKLKHTELENEGFIEKEVSIKEFMGDRYNFEHHRIAHNMKKFYKWYNLK